jgi:hypothetical protein
VPAWPDGPGFEITGIPESETFVILGAGGEEHITGGSNGLPSQSIYTPTGMVEGYIETDSLDVSNVNYLGSAGTLTVNGTNAGTAPTVTNATSSVTAFAVTPTNNATYQLTSETQTCYLLPIPSGEIPPPSEPPPCGDTCGDPTDPDPGPDAVQSQQITLTQIAPFAEGSGYPTSQGGCIAVESSPISVTFTGVPHITSISQQSANVNSSGTFTVTGTNLEDSEGISTPYFSTTITSSLSGPPGQSSENVSFSVPGTQSPGNYQFTISNMWGTSNAVSFGIPYSPVTVTGISPATWIAGQSYQAVQITGTNFGLTPTVKLSDPTITVSAPYNTASASGISTTYINLSVLPTTPSEPVIVTVTPGSFGSSFIQVPGGPSLPGSNTAIVLGVQQALQQASCPDMLDSNGHDGFTDIISTGITPGGSGTMTLTFNNGSFNGFGVTVPYGQFSTPESIAAHIAALITSKYNNQGLSAQAIGSQIIYQGIMPVGIATFTTSESSPSFTSDGSPQQCPKINPDYALIVTHDSGTWVPNSRGGLGFGRDVSYELSKWTKGNYNVNRPQLSSSQISEHLSKPLPDGSYGKTDTEDPGAYCDLIGSSGGPSLTGIYNPERYFTVVYTDPQHVTHDLGSVQILDKSGAHSTDTIVVNFPSGPTILNRFDQNHLLSYPQTLRLVKGPCGN